MLYTEPIPRRTWCLFLTGVFALLYLLALPVRELQPAEALHLLVARGMLESGNFLAPQVNGEPVAFFPLYAWTVVPLLRLGLPPEWCARLPAALAVFGMAAVAGRMAAWAAGHLAGAVAASAVLTSAIALSHGAMASDSSLFALLISLAWAAWYRLGRVHRRWGAAWIIGLCFVGLAFFARGASAFLYFYLPLLFLRRPLRITRRFLLIPHVATAAVVLFVAVSWLQAVPGQTWIPWEVYQANPPPGAESYLAHLLLFPWHCVVAFLPWTLFVWPAFCVAFRAAQPTPILCGFLRTLVVVLLLAGWLMPGTAPHELLPLLVPLGILVGLYYQVLLRRYIHGVRYLSAWVPPVLFALAGLGLLLVLLHLTGIVVFGGLPHGQVLTAAAAQAVGMALAWWLWRRSGARPVWMRTVVAVVVFMLVFRSLSPAIHGFSVDRGRLTAQRLADGVPPGAVIYLSDQRPLLVESVYLGRTVRRIVATRELPGAAPEVYVLGGAKPPILETRSWSPVTPAVSLPVPTGVRAEWRPAGGELLRLLPLGPENTAGGSPIRMYKGVRRAVGTGISGSVPVRVNDSAPGRQP